MSEDIYYQTLRAIRFNLKSRLYACSGYQLNSNLQIECNVLRKQIDLIDLELLNLENENRNEKPI